MRPVLILNRNIFDQYKKSFLQKYSLESRFMQKRRESMWSNFTQYIFFQTADFGRMVVSSPKDLCIEKWKFLSGKISPRFFYLSKVAGRPCYLKTFFPLSYFYSLLLFAGFERNRPAGIFIEQQDIFTENN